MKPTNGAVKDIFKDALGSRHFASAFGAPVEHVAGFAFDGDGRPAGNMPTAEELKRFVANLDGVASTFLVSRQDLFNQFFDRTHKINEECGYPEVYQLTPEYYRELYDFDPIANRVVQLMPMESWQGSPMVYELERSDKATDFEQAWDEMCNSLTPATHSWHQDESGSPVWEHLLRVDVLSGIGQFGVMLMGLDDGRNLQDPADGVEIIANVKIRTPDGRVITTREWLPDSPISANDEKVVMEQITANAKFLGDSNPDAEFQRFKDTELIVNHAGEKVPRIFWDREKEACVVSEIGWLIVNRQTAEIVNCPWNRKQIQDHELRQILTENAWSDEAREAAAAARRSMKTAEHEKALNSHKDRIAELNKKEKVGGLTTEEDEERDDRREASKEHRTAIAHHVADAINNSPREGLSAKVFVGDSGKTGAEPTHIYVNRSGSKIGHIEIGTRGEREYNLERNKAGIKDDTERHLKGQGPQTINVQNKVTKEPDPYLGRTTAAPPAGSAGYPGSGPFVQGTDRQYSQGFGIGMPAPIGEIDGGPALSGTDQQYFGVQFGPSEAFSDEPTKQKRKLLFLRCFDESLVQVVRYEWNIRNPRFGLPVMYRITLNDPRQPHSGVGLPLATVYVHWSRVIHVADNLHASEIFGVPRLRPVIPPVLDCRKVRGAGAEGYWQSCFTGLSLETQPQLGGDVLVDVPALQQMMSAYRERLQRWITLSGMTAKTIAPAVTDPTPHIAVNIEAICIKMGCPIRVFKGAERGELASSQDDEDWNERRQARQVMYLTPKVIAPLVDRLIQIGVLPEPGSGQTVTENVTIGLTHVTRVRKTWCGGVRRRDAKGRLWRVANRSDLRNGRPTVLRAGTRWVVVRNAGDDPPEVDEDSAPVDADVSQDEDFAGESVGYHIEWPDVDALGKKDKAGIALQNTQALGQYVSAGIEQVMSPLAFLTKILGWEEEEAQAVIDETEKKQQEEDEQNQDLADEHGFVPQPPDGFQQDPSQFQDDGQDGDGDTATADAEADDDSGAED